MMLFLCRSLEQRLSSSFGFQSKMVGAEFKNDLSAFFALIRVLNDAEAEGTARVSGMS